MDRKPLVIGNPLTIADMRVALENPVTIAFEQNALAQVDAGLLRLRASLIVAMSRMA